MTRFEKSSKLLLHKLKEGRQPPKTQKFDLYTIPWLPRRG